MHKDIRSVVGVGYKFQVGGVRCKDNKIPITRDERCIGIGIAFYSARRDRNSRGDARRTVVYKNITCCIAISCNQVCGIGAERYITTCFGDRWVVRLAPLKPTGFLNQKPRGTAGCKMANENISHIVGVSTN